MFRHVGRDRSNGGCNCVNRIEPDVTATCNPSFCLYVYPVTLKMIFIGRLHSCIRPSLVCSSLVLFVPSAAITILSLDSWKRPLCQTDPSR